VRENDLIKNSNMRGRPNVGNDRFCFDQAVERQKCDNSMYMIR